MEFTKTQLSNMYHTCKLRMTCKACEYENTCLPIMKANTSWYNVFSDEFQILNKEKIDKQAIQNL